ncbi:MAG: PIG-L family deacetylase [Comamonas sp.]
MENWFTPTKPCALPAARKVLVLAPHPDDEIFGCGGAISLYAMQAVPVHVHILTDGAGYAPDAERAAISATRQQESRQALAGLGAGIDCEFGPYEDRALLTQSGLIAHMLALLEQHQPQMVLAPSPWEIHPDHQACARAAAAAVMQWRRKAQADVGLMLYEIGSPLRANMLLDITSVWERKEQAMQSFASQLQQQDYIRHVKGLNAYRTYTLPRAVRYAEAYFHLSADDIAAMDSGAEPAALAHHLAAQCMDRWVESALQSASVHAEGLQQALLAQREHSTQLELQRELRAQQREQENLQHQQEIQRHQQEIQRHQQLNQQQQQENQRLRLEHDELHQQWLARENALRQQLLAQEQQAMQAIQAMQVSRSWRITAPLRALAGWAKR